MYTLDTSLGKMLNGQIIALNSLAANNRTPVAENNVCDSSLSGLG